MMKRIILALAIVAGPARADTPWLTITGDADDPQVDTIQINPVALSNEGAKRVMEVRVSRGAARVSTDKVQFRSFNSQVEFDCTARTARFVRSQFYAAPLWKEPVQAMVYPSTKVRPMEFRGIEPNPRDRVIHAACAVAGRK